MARFFSPQYQHNIIIIISVHTCYHGVLFVVMCTDCILHTYCQLKHDTQGLGRALDPRADGAWLNVLTD